MKKLLFVFILISAPTFLFSQSCAMRSMFRSYDPGKEVKRIHIPSCLTTCASWFVDDADAKMILKQIKSVYVMASEDKEFSRESNFPSEIARKLKKRNFEEMMTVNSEGDKVDMLVRQRGKKRNEFIIAVDGDEDVMVYIRSKLELSELLSKGDFGFGGPEISKIMKDI